MAGHQLANLKARVRFPARLSGLSLTGKMPRCGRGEQGSRPEVTPECEKVRT